MLDPSPFKGGETERKPVYLTGYDSRPALEGSRVGIRGMAAILTLLAVIVVGFSTWNLTAYPVISGWDEGMYLQFAQNLLHHGEYATRNAGDFERLTPSGGSGPIHVGAITIAMAVAGDNLLSARFAMVFFLISASVGCFLLLHHTGGMIAAIVGTLCFLVAGYQSHDTLWLGRQVLAEVPALSFLLFGCYFWQRSWSRNTKNAVAAAICIFLAIVAKNQLILILLPTFLVVGIVDRFYYGQLRWWHTVVPLLAASLGYASWIIASLLIVGPDQQSSYLESMSANTAAQFLQLGPKRWLTNLRALFHSGQWVVVLAALIANFWTIRQQDKQSLGRFSVVVITLFALISFLAVSLPWPRYMHLTLALAMLCAALSSEDVVRWLMLRFPSRRSAIITTLVILFVLLIGPRYIANGRRIAAPVNHDAQNFAKMLDTVVPPGVNIHNWEWEIEFYSSRNFTHPDFRLFPALVGAVYNGQYDPILSEPRIPYATTHIIIGPFSRNTRVFEEELLLRSAEVVARVGDYELYELTSQVP